MQQAVNNKEIVQRFNKAFIEEGHMEVFHEIMDPGFINHSAPAGTPAGPEGVLYFFNHFLKPAFPDLKVEILRQVADEDLVTTHKLFHCRHTAAFMGIPPTGKKIVMEVIDIIRLRDGKFVEHWNVADWQNIIQQLSN